MVMPLRNNIANNGRWPAKLNDYLSMGKPIVSTEITIVSKLFQNIKFGELAKDIPEDFAQKICSLLNNEEKLNLYGKNALKLAHNHLAWPVLMDELNQFIIETIDTTSKKQ